METIFIKIRLKSMKDHCLSDFLLTIDTIRKINHVFRFFRPKGKRTL